MADILSISALVVSIGAVTVNCIKTAHIQKCKSLCCWSDCSEPAKGRSMKIVKKGSGLELVECPPTPPSPDTPDTPDEPPATIGVQPKISNC
tara:strand:+ start:2725 stop:3000 length:276 start_codon:yes stop_codon:yes gene_type:complete